MRVAGLSALCLTLATCVAACVPGGLAGDPHATAARLAEGPRDCSAVPGTCAFANAPLRLAPQRIDIPGRPYPFHRTARALDFVDGAGRRWTAPAATLTDGASIPLIFVPIVGSPRTAEFAAAAALHDALCGIGNEDGPVWHGAPWPEVHRMFYDTLITGGTPEVKAKVMFAAVWLGGPRWHPVTKAADTRLDRLPPPLRRETMARVKAHIERENPPMARLLPYLQRVEHEMLDAAFPEGGVAMRDPNGDGTTKPGPDGAVRP